MQAIAFWDKRAEKYAASAIGDEAAYPHMLERELFDAGCFPAMSRYIVARKGT